MDGAEDEDEDEERNRAKATGQDGEMIERDREMKRQQSGVVLAGAVPHSGSDDGLAGRARVRFRRLAAPLVARLAHAPRLDSRLGKGTQQYRQRYPSR